MAYLDNSTITLDAVLTKRGRDLLSKGQEFKITQFAFSDDEIDYTLWNSSHPSGSDSFGNIIENTPILEAITDGSQVMKYKLISIPNITNTLTRVFLPQIIVNEGSITANTTVSVSTRLDSEVIYTITPITKLTVTGTNVTDYALDTSLGYRYLLGKSVSSLLNTNGLFTDVTTQIYSTKSSREKEDSDLVLRTGSALYIKLRKLESDFPTTFDIPITITGNETGAVFEFIFRVSNTSI